MPGGAAGVTVGPMTRTTFLHAALAATLLLTLPLTACGGSGGVDKSGGAAHRTVTLTFAAPDGDDALGQAFVSDVARRSGGSVKLRRAPHDYSSRLPAHEVTLARDL